jgi:transcriptional regulator with XRE-family HTH domain
MTARSELGEFLRACRAAVSPQDAGVPATAPGRRVRGLRREEVAHLAGVSVDYYTRLEQGRHASPSESVVDALARALHLDAAAHAHLADLARTGLHRPERPQVQRVRPAVHQMLDALLDQPAFVLGRRTDVLAANALARALATDWQAMPARDRNYTRWIVLDPAARELHLDWHAVAADVVGTLRLDAGRHPDDPLLNQLVGELTIKSPEFRGWWNDHRVHQRTHGIKRLQHPVVGPITIHYEALALPGDSDQTLFIYTTEPGSTSHDNLRLLASWAAGHQASSPAPSMPPESSPNSGPIPPHRQADRP